MLPLHAVADHPRQKVLDETRRIRAAVGLPVHYLVLGEPPESMLLMDFSAGGQFVWCDAIDAPRLGKEQLATAPEIWHSSAQFFAHLLDEEESDRG